MVAPTALAATVDRNEYSRFERERSIITVFVTTTGVSMSAEPILVQLYKARRNRDVVAAFKTFNLTNATSSEETVTFDLKNIVDSSEAPLIRRGDYFIRISSVNDTLITADTEDFIVSLITVERLRQDYLHGTDQKASDILLAKDQPIDITGVTITEVSRGHPQKWASLAYNITSDGNSEFIRTLSWCAGPQVTLVQGKKTYTLRRGTQSADWISVRIPTLNTLPSATVAEDILIDRLPLDEQRIRDIIDQAISWLEESELDIYLEPTRIVTIIDPTTIVVPTGTDILSYQLADWDAVVDAVTYKVPAATKWINFKMPYRPIIRFDELFGQIANTRIVDIALEWIEVHERGGFTQLVPFNQEVAFNFIGLIWVEALRGPVDLPNFWNFDAIVGFRETPRTLIELVAKKAAIDVLTIAGQAFRGGFSSQSVSRDGISESVSYTASATFGIYSATIEDYRKWIDANLVKFRGAFRGANMVVV